MKKTTTQLFLLVLLAGLCMSNMINAQTPTWAWAKDTTAIATGGLTTDASGNIYVANDFGDVFLVKYDNTGQQLWAKSAAGSQDSPPATNTYPNGIALDPSGNILVTGFFTSATLTLESTVLTRVSTVDMFVAKYTSAGNLLWAKSAAIGNVGNVGFNVASDAAGNAIVVGSYSAASMTIGTTTFTNPCTSGGGCPSMLVVKYDGTNGAVLWAKSSFAGVGTSYCYSVATDASNNVYVGGDFSKTGNTRNSIVKYNSLGDTLWTQSNGGWFVTTDGSGNLYSGYDKVANNGLVKKYNSATGAVAWTTTPTGNTSNKGVATRTDAAGNVYYAGTFRSTSITFGTFTVAHAGSGSDDDIFIVKYDNTGTPLWATAVGGTGFDALNGFTVDNGGNVYVGGFFLSPSLTFGSTTLNVLGLGYNVFFARLGDANTGVNHLYMDNAFRVYPNPSKGKFMIEFTNKQSATNVEVYNLVGEKIQTGIGMQQQTAKEIDLSNAPKGIYFVKMSDGEKMYTNKIVVE